MTTTSRQEALRFDQIWWYKLNFGLDRYYLISTMTCIFRPTFSWLFLEPSLREWIERNKCSKDGKAASRDQRELRNYANNNCFVELEIWHLELNVFCKLVFLPLIYKVQRKLYRLLSIIIKITSDLLYSSQSPHMPRNFLQSYKKHSLKKYISFTNISVFICFACFTTDILQKCHGF